MDKETLKNNAHAFLQEQEMGVVSTVGKDAIPESASVNFFVDDAWELTILTDKDSRKVQNLRDNPHIAFVAGTSPIPNTVQIQGTAEIIENAHPSYEELFQKLVDSHRLDKDPIYNMFGKNYVILRIKIDWLRWLYFDKTNGNAVYTVLIP